MSRYHSAYFHLLVASLVLSFSPFKLVAYFLPFLGFFLVILVGHQWHVLKNILLASALIIMLVLLHAAFEPDFLWHSAMLSVITFGSLFFALTVPTKNLQNNILLEKSITFCHYLLFVEGCWGIAQVFYGFLLYRTFDNSLGDRVTGTISPFVPDLSFSNPMFAVNISFLILFLVPFTSHRRGLKVSIILGTLALLFSSVMHIIAFFLISISVGYLLISRLNLRRYLALLMVVFLFFVFMIATQRKNLDLFSSYAELFWESKIPKAAITKIALNDMPSKDLSILFYGVGPGQFVSRAGLIGTGMYLGSLDHPKKIPLIPTGISRFVKRYVIDLWYVSETDNSFRGSFLAKPWYSWLTIFSEFGLVGLVPLIVFIFWLLFEAVRSSHFQRKHIEGICFVAAIMLFVMIGSIENYWESSQAVFCGILLMKIQFSRRNIAPSKQ
jgi:hypothetical protein